MHKEKRMKINSPNCGEPITLEQNVYDEIASKIRNEEFDKEVKKQTEILGKQKDSEIEIAIVEGK